MIATRRNLATIANDNPPDTIAGDLARDMIAVRIMLAGMLRKHEPCCEVLTPDMIHAIIDESIVEIRAAAAYADPLHVETNPEKFN